MTGKRTSADSSAMPTEGVVNNPGESIRAYINRLTDIAGSPTDRADSAIEAINEGRAWVGFARYLRRQEGVRTWDEFVDLWNEYQHESRRMEPPGRRPPPGEGSASASGAGKFVETPESLRLQPKAKPKAKAKRGSRPRTVTRKIQLTNPVLPYHDIMNDGYYIKA